MPQLIGLGRHSALLVDMAPVSAVTNASRWWRRDRRAPSEVAFLHCALASCGAVYCNRFCLWVCDSGRAVPEPYYSQRARAAQCLRLSERFFIFACICQNSGLECSTGMWRREFPGSYGNPAGRKRGAEMKTQFTAVRVAVAVLWVAEKKLQSASLESSSRDSVKWYTSLDIREWYE